MGNRAKMSSRETRENRSEQFPCFWLHEAEFACNEARAILAETEPADTGLTHHVDVDMMGAFYANTRFACAAALAESLSALIATSDVAAFLQTRQHVAMGERS